MRKLTFPIMLAIWIVPAFGGAVWLEFGNPEAINDPAAKGALFTVRPISLGFTPPGHCIITGTAEGLIGQERKSIPLDIVKLNAPTAPCLHAVKWNVPKEGVWGLLLTLDIGGPTVGKTVEPIRADTFDRKPKVVWWGSVLPEKEVDDVRYSEMRQVLKMLIAVHCDSPVADPRTELGWACRHSSN